MITVAEIARRNPADTPDLGTPIHPNNQPPNKRARSMMFASRQPPAASRQPPAASRRRRPGTDGVRSDEVIALSGLTRPEHDDAPLRRDAAEHAGIARHLLDADLPGAIAAIKANWYNGMERILDLIPES